MKKTKNKLSGKKRKLLATIGLILSLWFGKPRLSPSRSSSQNVADQLVNERQVVNERVIVERELNSLEENDRQVILVKTGDNLPTSFGRQQPSNFPTPARTNSPAPRPKLSTPYVNPFRRAPTAANPAGAGNGELVNLMISVLFQKKNNHKNRILLITV